jgi:hypothetical protein
VRVGLCDALEVDGGNGWLVSWNLLDEPHRSAGYPHDRQHNAGPLPPVDPGPPHEAQISTLRGPELFICSTTTLPAEDRNVSEELAMLAMLVENHPVFCQDPHVTALMANWRQ